MTPDPVIALTELKSRLSPADWKTICDYVLAERELMEAYAAKKVAEALRALETQMEDQADDTTPSSIHRQNGKVWLEGWFDFPKALAANQHHGGNDADT